MTTTRYLAAILLLMLAGIAPLPAAGPAGTSQAPAADVARAQALLAKAVLRFRAAGDQALAEFSRQGEFIDNELYVYALDTEGMMLSSGGPSASLIGRRVSDMRDVAGKPFFAEMLAKARTEGRGEVEYRWVNWADNSIQRKRTFFEKVGDRILAVGYYVPRSSPAEVEAFLGQAVAAMKASPPDAIREFNRLDGHFVQDDLYVFVVDVRSGRFVAHGAMPRLIGSDGLGLRDQAGTPIIRNMLEQAAIGPRGSLEYLWRNPVTRRTEEKHTMFEVVGEHIVAVGYFKP
jgi:cytochrome c